MLLIAASGSRKTDWAMLNGANVVERAETAGLNPYFHSRREISHLIRLQLPEQFFHTRYDMIYFYGAGCAVMEKAKIVESSLISQLRSRTQVNSDLLGAARALLQDSAGLVSILGTGSNSCYYNGEKIEEHVIAGGFILGDEGSNTHMGKLLASDVLKKIAPQPVIDLFYKEMATTPEKVLDQVYESANAMMELSRYRDVLLNNIHIPYCRRLVKSSFDAFFERNILAYDITNFQLSAIGTACYDFKEIFIESAKKYHVNISDIQMSSIEGLIRYHIKNN